MSGSGGTDDPFGWSNERLVQELCTSSRSWPAPPPKKWPEPDLLAAMLQQHDLDGSDLLCYEDIMGQGGFELLCADLGVVKIPHKMSLRIAIRFLQNRSPDYRAWKEAKVAADTLLEQPQDIASLPLHENGIETSVEHYGSALAAPNKSGFDLLPAPELVSNNVGTYVNGTMIKPASYDQDPITTSTNGHTLPVAATSSIPSSPPTFPVKRSNKRKRIAPTNVSSTAHPQAHRRNPFNDIPKLRQDSVSGAYLGSWALTEDALLQPSDPLDPASDDNLDTGDFGWSHPMPIPAGRRRQVDRIFRRHLQPARPSTANLGRTYQQPRNGNSQSGHWYEEVDEVLPALGESDDEGYDTETWDAMEQEATERKEQELRKRRPLPIDTVDAIISDAIRDIEAKWIDRKLPRLRRREHIMWTSARNSGSRKFLFNKALRDMDQYEQRIKKLVQEMRQVEWRNEKEVRMQAIVLDANIEDKQHALWESRLYSATSAPTKPVGGKPLAWRQPPAQRVRPSLDGFADILTDSSGDDDGGRVAQGLGTVDEDGHDEGSSSDVSMELSDGSSDQPEMLDQSAVSTPRSYRLPDRVTTGQPSFQTGRSASTLATDFPLHGQSAIAEKGVSYWEAAGDVTRLLCTIFSNADRPQLARLLQSLSLNVDDLWQKFCVPVLTNLPDKADPGTENRPEDDATAFTRYFYIFLIVRNVTPPNFLPQDENVHRKIVDGRGVLGSFCVKMRTIAPYLTHLTERLTEADPAAKKTTDASKTGPVNTNVESTASSERAESSSSVHKDQPAAQNDEDTDGDDSGDVPISRLFRRHGRLVAKDQGAQSLRDRDKARQEEQENRRKVLYQSLAQTGQLTQDQTRLIINEAKDKNHGFVYVDNWIGQNIRNHQIDGVRFMWNQIIAPPESRQGCLLAHTMGLGKTMQVITLLVSIADAARSPDPSISSQIPLDLRESKTLILCPAGLVENWQDELIIWSQTSTLGPRYSVVASMEPDVRMDEVRQWAQTGGTLVLGYNMFKQLEKDFGREAISLLESTPNIVIADEAHALKNPTSKIHQLTGSFRTSARIAMTGSPLANSVTEYHAMINWVAPNYLAARDEFNATYANPIKEGFYRDSTMSQRRHAYKMLKVLKDTVAPKIHRLTVSNLQGVLPEKREFILYLALTPLQMGVYHTFIRLIKQPRIIEGIQNTVQLWNLLVNLTLLLGHPKIFRDRLLQMKAVLANKDAKGLRTGTLPPHMVDELLTAVSVPEMEDLSSSSKMVVLMGILDEAKRVGEKVLVFSQSKLVLDFLEVEFRRQNRLFHRLDGDTPVSKRQDMVKDFNAGADEVYLISTTAGGLGLNIQGANRVVIFDFKWNPMHEQQAIGRAYRIGQTCKVFVYWLIVGETFETVLHDQAVFKTQLASRVVDKKNPLAWADQLRNYTKDPAIMLPDPSLATRFESRDPVLAALLASSDDATQLRICKIVTTDTLEQEEPEVKLSPEDLTEAANMVNLNKMRKRLSRDGPARDNGGPFRFAQATAGPPVERTQVDGGGFPPAAAPARNLPVPQPHVPQPHVLQPPVLQPPVLQPPVLQPPVSQTPVAQPPVSQPPVPQPPVPQPPVLRPPVLQPTVSQQPLAQPPLAKPPVAKPPVAQPSISQLPVLQPPASQPPVLQPPVSQPPVAKPPASQPPVAKPPASQPPTSQPPVLRPPVAQPPIAQPPVAQPSVAQPSVAQPSVAQLPVLQPPVPRPAKQNLLPAPPPMQIPTTTMENTVHIAANPIGGEPAEEAAEDDPLFQDPVPEASAARPARPVSAASAVSATPPSSSGSLAGSPGELIHVLKQVLLSGRITTQQQPNPRTADTMARKAVADISLMMKVSGVPARAQWGRLRALVQQEPLLVEMIVYGAIEPAQLATMAGTEEMAFVSHVLFAISEMNTVGADGEYSVQNTPHCCSLFGSTATLERIVDRKLYEGDTSVVLAARNGFSWTMAGDLAARVGRNLPSSPLKMTMLARCAVRAFRDTLFVGALLSGAIDIETWPLASLSKRVALVRGVHDRHAADLLSQAADDTPSAAASGGAASARNTDFGSIAKPEPPDGVTSPAGGGGSSAARSRVDSGVEQRAVQKKGKQRTNGANTAETKTLPAAPEQSPRVGDSPRNPFVLDD
ncbi:hypothetical protein SEPCBS119000_005809 [Sporothrix epigloea]|uniref:Snf2 family helicase n=1 Tax=Sporothrix epigloea TaxID=1892477 RepID=A0ABP0E333_9PEZI